MKIGGGLHSGSCSRTFLLDDWMDAHLYNGYVVAATLIIYGVLFIVLENHNQYTDFPIQRTGQISYRTAFFIGLFQVLSLVPGTSRSGSTILGAMIWAAPVARQRSFPFSLVFRLCLAPAC